MIKATIEEILEDYKQGKMIILMDDEDRENEGDLIIPAATCTKEDINFMATHGRGLICLTLTQERCKQLNLPLMVAQNNDANGTKEVCECSGGPGGRPWRARTRARDDDSRRVQERQGGPGLSSTCYADQELG